MHGSKDKKEVMGKKESIASSTCTQLRILRHLKSNDCYCSTWAISLNKLLTILSFALLLTHSSYWKVPPSGHYSLLLSLFSPFFTNIMYFLQIFSVMFSNQLMDHNFIMTWSRFFNYGLVYTHSLKCAYVCHMIIFY